MGLIKRVTDIEPEGPDTIVTMSFSGFGTPMETKTTARGRAIMEAGLNVPKSLRERERITKIEDFEYQRDGIVEISGFITVRVRNAR